MLNTKLSKLAITAAVNKAVKQRKNNVYNLHYLINSALCYSTTSVYKHACKQVISNLNTKCLSSLITANTRVFKTSKLKRATSTYALYNATLNNKARTKVVVNVYIQNAEEICAEY
jgi:hypothetical protein